MASEDLRGLNDRELLLLTAHKVNDIDERLAGVEDKWFPGLQRRVSKLEHWRSVLAGAWVVLGGGIWLAWDLFKDSIKDARP